MYQQLAWILSVVLMLALACVFYWIYSKSHTKEEYGPIVEKAYRIRKIWFYSLVTVMMTATILSLSHLPYHKPINGVNVGATVVDVKAFQFGWEFSTEDFKAGQPYQFNVTSKDVNHGFGIYDENMELIAQTQAMPEYTNSVHITFDKPGKYRILCLEYCNVGHHAMVKEITVK